MERKQLEEKWSVEAELSATKKEIIETIESIDSLNLAAQKSQVTAKCFYSTNKIIVNEKEKLKDPEEYKRLQKVAEQAETDLEEAENRKVSLENKVNELQEKLESYVFKISQAEIATLQSIKDEAVNKIATIKKVLSGKEEELAVLLVDESESLSGIIEKKEALFAAQALGEDIEPGAIEKVDQQLLSLEKTQTDSKEKVNELAHVVSGLKAELVILEKEHSFLNKQYKEAFFSFLQLEAEKLGRQYVKHAKGLSSTYLKINAIDRVLAAHGPNEMYIGPTSGALDIPGLNLPKCQGTQRLGERSYVFQSKESGPQQEVENLKQYLLENGIKPPKISADSLNLETLPQ